MDRYFLFLMVTMIISGSINTLDSKFQNQQLVNESGVVKYFYHPYMQAYTIYIATAIAFPIFLLRSRLDPQGSRKKLEAAKAAGKIIEYNRFKIMICTVTNLIANNFQNIALNFISGSVYQMTRGGTIATTFLFSVFYLKYRSQRHQIVGSTLAVVGVVVVGVSNVLYSHGSQKSEGNDLQVVGYILLIISLVLNGFSLTFQENLLKKYHLEPIELTGYEGIFGISVFTILLIGLTFIPCSFGNNACVLYNGDPYLQRPDVYFQQLGDHYPLLLTTILQIFSLLVFNISGVTITRYSNALSRSICDVTRTVVIWIVGIIVTVTVGKEQENYRWESTDTGAIVLLIVGFMVLISGNLIYNQIIRLSCFVEKDESGSYMTIDEKNTKSENLL